MPLKNLENHYSIDASGFGGYQNERWMNVKYHKRDTFSKYLKGSIAIGTKPINLLLLSVPKYL